MAILSSLRNVAAQNGVFLSKVTDIGALTQFFRDVHPKNIEGGLVRLGASTDGGYLVPNDFDGVEACFSPGVADTATFESQLVERGIKSYLADFSVEEAPISNEMISFEKKFLGDTDGEIYMRLETWVQSKVGNTQNDLLLQMDIEGAEFHVILDTPSSILNRFRMIIVEFHGMDRLFDQSGFLFINQAFQKLLKDFTVCHIHPNNVDPVWKHGPFGVPRTLEFTFLRKDRVVPTGQALSFPHPLDSPNVAERKDIVLPACWWQDI